MSGRRTGTISLADTELTLSEPTFYDMRVFDEATGPEARPFAAVLAMGALVHACLVAPKLTAMELEKSLTRAEMEEAFVFAMRLGGAKEPGKGEAGGA